MPLNCAAARIVSSDSISDTRSARVFQRLRFLKKIAAEQMAPNSSKQPTATSPPNMPPSSLKPLGAFSRLARASSAFVMAGAVVGDVEEGDADDGGDEIDIVGGGDGGAKGDGGGAGGPKVCGAS